MEEREQNKLCHLFMGDLGDESERKKAGQNIKCSFFFYICGENVTVPWYCDAKDKKQSSLLRFNLNFLLLRCQTYQVFFSNYFKEINGLFSAPNEVHVGVENSRNQLQCCTSLSGVGLLLWGVWRPSMVE